MSFACWLKNSLLTLSLIVTLTPTLCIRAETWQAELIEGGVTQVDPQTHKGTVHRNGNATPLRDGIHKLEDGSIVIIHDGIAIPNSAMYHAWSTMDNSQHKAIEINECVQLTRRVCGIKNSCAKHKSCELALQLQQLWEDDSDNSIDSISNTEQNECHKGLINVTTFPPCVQDIEPPLACTKLVIKTCGDSNQCHNVPVCNVARQLLNLAQEASLKNPETVNESAAEQYCSEAIHNRFFVACPKELNH